MAKLFLFGIGGTGARVVKSLAMLLASGVELHATDVIVPILIDPDNANGDLTDAIDILNTYKIIRDKIVNSYTVDRSNKPRNGFFKTEIKSLNQAKGTEYRYRLKLTPTNQANDRFGSYIDFDTLEGSNQKLAELLFSGYHKVGGNEKSLFDLETHIGVKGNPQVGSVILNQFNADNPDFVNFAKEYVTGDRIFITSSIFGGTGAAGFPLLLKNIRNANNVLVGCKTVTNSGLIPAATIGAISVLPYFKLEDGDIDSSNFISKSKAALEYYIYNVNPFLNALYYIGYKDNTNDYKNNPGAANQKNPAHFIELASALSIIDFMNWPDTDLPLPNGNVITEPKTKEFGIENFSEMINFTNFDKGTNEIIKKALCQYQYFIFYLDKQIKHSINNQPWSNRSKIKINKKFIIDESGFFSNITQFNKYYKKWLTELASNKPNFSPFNLKVGENNIFEMVNGVSPNKTFWKSNFSFYNDCLNDVERYVRNFDVEDRFMTIFYKATDLLVKKIFNF
jgi:hypothetical protein